MNVDCECGLFFADYSVNPSSALRAVKGVDENSSDSKSPYVRKDSEESFSTHAIECFCEEHVE